MVMVMVSDGNSRWSINSSSIHVTVKLLWTFPGAPLTFDGALRIIQGNIDKYVVVG